jgi:CBS domain-containing protein
LQLSVSVSDLEEQLLAGHGAKELTLTPGETHLPFILCANPDELPCRDIVCKGLAQDGFDPGRATARDVMTPGIHCCREDDDLAKAVRHMEQLQVRRLPVINKSKRMVGIISLGDVGRFAPNELLAECVKSVSAHH